MHTLPVSTELKSHKTLEILPRATLISKLTELKDKFISAWAKTTWEVSSIGWNKMENQADLYLGHFIVWNRIAPLTNRNRFMPSLNQKQPLKKIIAVGCTLRSMIKKMIKCFYFGEKKKTKPKQQRMSLKPLCYSSSFHTGNKARKTCCSDFSYGKMTDILDRADSWLKSHH